MNITLLCIFPNYFNATGLCQALEDHCGHTVTQFVNVHKPQDFYHWPVHHRHCALHDMVSLKESLSQSDLVIVCGAMVFLGWEKHSKLPAFKDYIYPSLDDFWADIPAKAKTAMIISDSAVLEQDWTERIARFDTVFAMPDLFDYVQHPNLYPALQVNESFQWPMKPWPHQKVLIAHSPGNKLDKDRKGTAAINQVLLEVARDGFDFDFKVLTGLDHDECLKAKHGMDIFIDQLQDPPQSPVGKGMKPFLGALGKSGQEGMCNGCATITSGNLVSTEPYFPNPPVIIANTKAALKYEIANLLRHPDYRYRKARQQYWWATQYLKPEFVSNHIMRCINGATTPQIQKDMERINSKLDDSWNRYYGEGWPDLKARYDRIVGSVEHGPVLDIGCGPGVACNELSKKGHSVVGVDYSDRMVEIAISNGIEAVWARAEKLPFQNDRFNTVIMGEVLEHVEDEKLAVAEADRVARSGARIIVTVPNGGTISRWHLRTFDKDSLRELLPWQIEELEIMNEWIWAKCKKN